MAIPAEFLEELRARSSVAEVVGKRVRLARKGRDLVGLCPFHKEKSPSFTVFDDHYHCFGCGAHGTAIDFTMEMDHLGFREAVEHLAADVGLALPVEAGDREQARQRQGLHGVLEAATKYYERMLRMPEGAEALSYLRARGVGDDLIQHFRLGYAPPSTGGLRAALSRDGASEALMVEAGLLVLPEGGDRRPYDRFRQRVMFPIHDRRGRVVAFGGRILGAGEPKYLNSPETSVFRKGHLLYGLHHAMRPAREQGAIVVVEGYMDVIALHDAGFKNVVAPLGTALTVEQLGELWRVVPEPILLFDPDEAGQRAAQRAAERALPILRAGLGLRFAFLDTDTSEDPQGVQQRYAPQFLREALARALTLSDMIYRMEVAGRPLRSPEDRAALEERVRRRVATIADAALRAHFLSDFRERLWSALRKARSTHRPPDQKPWRSRQERAATRGASPGQAAAATKAAAANAGACAPGCRREAILLAVLIAHPESIDRIGERLGSLPFQDQDLDRLRQEALNALASVPNLDSARLQDHLRQRGLGAALDCRIGPEVVAHAFFARPGGELETALEGWEETYALHLRDHLTAELKDLAAAAVDGVSERSFEYFRELKRQEQAITHGETGTEPR